MVSSVQVFLVKFYRRAPSFKNRWKRHMYGTCPTISRKNTGWKGSAVNSGTTPNGQNEKLQIYSYSLASDRLYRFSSVPILVCVFLLLLRPFIIKLEGATPATLIARVVVKNTTKRMPRKLICLTWSQSHSSERKEHFNLSSNTLNRLCTHTPTIRFSHSFIIKG